MVDASLLNPVHHPRKMVRERIDVRRSGEERDCEQEQHEQSAGSNKALCVRWPRTETAKESTQPGKESLNCALRPMLFTGLSLFQPERCREKNQVSADPAEAQGEAIDGLQQAADLYGH